MLQWRAVKTWVEGSILCFTDYRRPIAAQCLETTRVILARYAGRDELGERMGSPSSSPNGRPAVHSGSSTGLRMKGAPAWFCRAAEPDTGKSCIRTLHVHQLTGLVQVVAVIRPAFTYTSMDQIDKENLFFGSLDGIQPRLDRVP